MVLYRDIVNLVNGLLIPRKVLDNDYVINSEELLSGKIFPLYKWNDNPSLLVNGIKYDEKDELRLENISIYWQELDSVSIISSEDFVKPQGGVIMFKSFAKYNLYSYDVINGKNLIKSYEGEIKTIYHLESDFCKLNKNEINVPINLTDNDREIKVSTIYRHGKISKGDTLVIKQIPNTISDWLLEGVKINNIFFSNDVDFISKDGGIIDLKVLQNIVKTYYKENSNGIVLSDRKEEEYNEDITNLCEFKLLGIFDYVKVLGNHIIVQKQDYGAEKRVFTIECRYKEFCIVKEFVQECGEIIEYVDNLYFPCNKDRVYTMNLPVGVRCDGYLPIVFERKKYVGNKLIDKISLPSYKLGFKVYGDDLCGIVSEFSNDWMRARIEDSSNNSGINIYFDIFEKNPSKINNRCVNLEISYENKSIFLNIVQPPLAEVRKEVYLEVSGENRYYKETIKNCYLEFTPKLKTYYEDDSYEEKVILDNNYDIICEIEQENEYLKPNYFTITDFNGKKSIKFDIFSDIDNINEFSAEIIGKIVDNATDDVICISDKFHICYENMLKEYNYIFETENDLCHTWKSSWTDEFIIPIKSFRRFLVNGEEKTQEFIDYTIKTTDSSHFGVDICNDVVKVRPLTKNYKGNQIKENIILAQEESNKEIPLTFIHEVFEKEEIPIHLSVIVESKYVENEIWSTDSLLFIKNDDETIYSLQLSPCFLYSRMDKFSDMIYDGYIILEKGKKYVFKSSGFKILGLESNKNYNFEEILSFNEKDKEMTFFIDL